MLASALSLDGFGPALLLGAGMTLAVSFCSLALGLFFGFLISYCQTSRVRVLNWLGKGYTTVVRGLPELLLLFLFYYGGTHLLSLWRGGYFEVSAFAAGVFSLGLIFGAYAGETLRAAFQSVDRGVIEATVSLGYSRWQTFSSVRLPLMFRYALPALGNLWLVLLKDSALISVIGLEDLMRKTQIAIGYTKQPFKFFLAAAVLYLALTVISSRFLRRWESAIRV